MNAAQANTAAVGEKVQIADQDLIVAESNSAGDCTVDGITCALMKPSLRDVCRQTSCGGVIFVKPEEFLVLRLKGLT